MCVGVLVMYTYGYLFYLPVNLIFILIFGVNGIMKKMRKEYYFYAAILAVYLNFLIDKAFFPLFTDGSQYDTEITNYINLKVFTLFHYTFYQIAGNILLTFPISFLLPFVINCGKRSRLIYSILFSISIEFIQLALIGFFHIVNMTFDINDILLNVAGCVLGNYTLVLVSKWVGNCIKRILSYS